MTQANRPGFTEMPVFELVTRAKMIASTLDGIGLPTNAELVRELCRRVVPVKLVPTRGAPIKSVRVNMPKLPDAPDKLWCAQCEQLVAASCNARFCKVVA